MKEEKRSGVTEPNPSLRVSEDNKAQSDVRTSVVFLAESIPVLLADITNPPVHAGASST